MQLDNEPDFDLFDAAEQAQWCFELRDARRPKVRLRRELLNMVELGKADRLGQLPERLSA